MKYRAAAVATLALAALALAGCSAKSPSDAATADKPAELTVLVTNSPSATALEKVGPLYTKKTGIQVKFDEVPYDQLGTKLVLAGKTKTSTFDIVQFDQPSLASVVPSGGLLDLDKLAKADKSYDIGDFDNALINYSSYDGKIYGVPLSTEPYVQFYRTDLYKKAGLTPAKTWKQVVSNSKAITALGSGYYGYDGPYDPLSSGEAYLNWLYGNGGRVVDPKTNEPLLSSALAKSVMKQYLSLVGDSNEATLSGSTQESATLFTESNVGLNIVPAGWYGTLANPSTSKVAKYVGVAPSPTVSNGKYPAADILKGWLIGVSAQSKHTTAAWQFLSFALGKGNVQTFISAGSPVVARNSTIASAKFQKEVPYLKDIKPAIQNGATDPTLPETVPILIAMAQSINQMADNHADVDSTMDALNAQVLTLLKNGGAIH